MTKQEMEWFFSLAEDRKESARVLMKPSNVGIWRAIIDKYSDQAHFIYELLQNADDAGATRAEFILEEDRLLFKHNGTRRFSITSPKTEEDDFKEGKIGDLNSITGAGGFSTKKSANAEGNAIGKFGVGFKAVFQYTTKPEIYDDNMAFRLENYMVPVLIDADVPWRNKGETLFVFPFDRDLDECKNPKGEIWKKLNTLVFPTLFLNKLKMIAFSDGKSSGEYKIDVLYYCEGDGFVVKKIAAVSKTAAGKKDETIWLFTKCDELCNKYCVGYMVDDTGKLKPVDYKAFCYFPTKHDTKLKFIIHAPFLLNDSRESIKDGQEHNFDMIAKLACLATTGLRFLCNHKFNEDRRFVDDDVVRIIPIKEEDYGDGISFDQFRIEFKRLFEYEQVVPTVDGYTCKEDAYWPESYALAKLFSDEQLNEIIGRRNDSWYYDDEERTPVHWAFVSFPKERRSNNRLDADIYDFISDCTSGVVMDSDMITHITGDFIERQKEEWLLSFYKWIAGNDERMDDARQIPIFLDQKGKACAAFGDEGQKTLFLPLEGETRYHFINEKLMKNKAYKKIVKYYELEQPNKADYIDLVIREKLDQATPEESDKYFELIFTHYIKLPIMERGPLENSLSDRLKLRCIDSYTNETQYRDVESLYFPTEDLKTYFIGFNRVIGQSPLGTEQNRGVELVDFYYYKTIVGENYGEELKDFLLKIGVKEIPEVVENKAWYYSGGLYELGMKFSYCTERKKDMERFLVRDVIGGRSLLGRIVAEKDFNKKKSLSELFWRLLCKCSEKYEYNKTWCKTVEGCRLNFLSGTHEYEYYGRHEEAFDSPFLIELRKESWLVVDDWTIKSPSDTAESELPDSYKELDGAKTLIAALGMPPYTKDDIEYWEKTNAREALSEEDRESLKYGEYIKMSGLTRNQVDEAIREYKDKERKINQGDRIRGADELNNIDVEAEESVVDKHKADSNYKVDTIEQLRVKRPPQGSVMYNIERKVEGLKGEASIQNLLAEEEEDADDITPKPIDFERRIRDRELKQANEIAALERGDELQRKALSCDKYSLGWFKAMLGLEMLGQEDDSSFHREVTMSFSKMVKEPDSERTYTLKHSSRNIPQWIEELSDVPLDMLVGKRSLRPRIEAMSVKSFDLRVKLKHDEKLEGVNLSELKEAKISVQRPDFLLNSLHDGLAVLPFEDEKNLRDGLTDQIEFVFGPPGTGKTTFLADRRIKNLMYRNPGLKVLVLTPTNKAADVLAGRVVTCMDDDESCKSWLVRFGATSDEFLEKSGILCGKNIDIGKMERCCVVATIARFPYDKYVPGYAEPTKIEDVDWDYIIIDEASMIPLVYMVYVLYQKQKTKFIIAGDPFQIDPIVRNAAWEGENIYKMVGLNDFVNPTTSPQAYPVKKLTTQYRSLPCIGEIFSRYRYGGVLEHARTMDDEGELRLTGLGIGKLPPLSIVKFPVSSYESIYSLKRLKNSGMSGSPYQIYSAILTFELVCAIARRRERKMGGGVFRIGVISPYKSQADLVQRLVESESIPEDTQISAGTIHGFQGDECDMIVALFNPPPGISGGKRSFVNKVNIVNVAISRARDYLVLVMPDDDTQKIENMFEVRKIESAMQNADPKALVIGARSLENWMFGSETYIEDNSFSSGHQHVNVYGDPERRYEVRSEDAAIDIQIHNKKGWRRFDPAPMQRKLVSRETNDFFSFLGGKAVLKIATLKAREYRDRYYAYRNTKAAGDMQATAKAYLALRDSAGFFFSHYNDYRRIEKNVPPFNEIMREVVRRLNNNIPLWNVPMW